MSYNKNFYNQNGQENELNSYNEENNAISCSSLDPEHVKSLRFHCDTITSINFSPNQ